MAETRSPEPSTVRVCGYLELAWSEVVVRLSSPTIDSVLSGALRDALGLDDGEVSVHASPPELVVGGNARVRLWWGASTPAGRSAEGSATIVVLPVQTGLDAVTELLIELDQRGRWPGWSTPTTHRFLEALVDRLARR